MSKSNFSILCNINTHHLTYYDLTRLILSLIIWHSRCTFFTIKSHLLNCTVLYSTGSLCTLFVTVNSFILGATKFIFFFYSYYHYLYNSGHYLSFFSTLFLPLSLLIFYLLFDLCHCNYYVFDLCHYYDHYHPCGHWFLSTQ